MGADRLPLESPRNRKFLITCTSAGLTLTVTFASSVLSASTVQLSQEFDVSSEVAVLTQALFILGFGVGPTIFGYDRLVFLSFESVRYLIDINHRPLSELYGRKTPLFIGFVIFGIFQIPVGVAQNLATVMICRFLQGTFGSSPTAVIGGLLADIWNPRERGFAMPSFAGVLFAGPVLGPVVGAFITDSHLGWRW